MIITRTKKQKRIKNYKGSYRKYDSALYTNKKISIS